MGVHSVNFIDVGRAFHLNLRFYSVAYLAARRLSEMLVAPFAGIADRFGTRLPLTIAVVASILGFAMIGGIG